MSGCLSQFSSIIGNPGANIFPGDCISSPSGVYYAILVGNPGQFTVFHGTNPTISGNTSSIWAVPATGGAGFGSVGYGQLQLLGNVGQIVYQSGPQDFNLTTDYGTVSDSGAFTIQYPSNGSTVQTFSSGVSDPVTSLSLSNLTYNLNGATFDTPAQIGGPSEGQTCSNTQPTSFSCSLSLSQSYTKSQTWNWNLSEAVTFGVTAGLSGGIAIPGLASGGVSVTTSASSTTTISGGQSATTTQTLSYTSSLSDTIPPDSEYKGYITLQQVDFSVPYTFTGVATYKSGATATVAGSGTFNGTDAYDFQVATACVRYRGGACPPELEIFPPSVPVPEPASLLLLAVPLFAATATQLLPVVGLAAASMRVGRRRHGRLEAVTSWIQAGQLMLRAAAFGQRSMPARLLAQVMLEASKRQLSARRS